MQPFSFRKTESVESGLNCTCLSDENWISLSESCAAYAVPRTAYCRVDLKRSVVCHRSTILWILLMYGWGFGVLRFALNTLLGD